MATNFETTLAANGLTGDNDMMLSYKGWSWLLGFQSVGRSLWNRSCGDRNCSRWATVPLGIDTLIANILVFKKFLKKFYSVHRFFDAPGPGPIFAKLCHTARHVLK